MVTLDMFPYKSIKLNPKFVTSYTVKLVFPLPCEQIMLSTYSSLYVPGSCRGIQPLLQAHPCVFMGKDKDIQCIPETAERLETGEGQRLRCKGF